MDDFVRIEKINVLGNLNMLMLLLEYLTKLSVNIEINNTSSSLDKKYKIGIIEWLFLRNGTEINFVRQSTSLQHKFNP